MGFDARWGVLGAADVGANHQRDRIWIVGKMGNSNNNGQTSTKITKSITQGGNTNEAWSQQASKFARSSKQYAELAYTNISQRKGVQQSEREDKEYTDIGSSGWWEIEPKLGRVADGVADRSHRLKAIGNGQVPLCAATAFTVLMDAFNA
jgi:DNA (cytosine-5)-methyltransferase 1